MKYITIFILFISLNINAQSDDFLLNLDCNNFEQNISANRQMNVDFISEERYISLIQDSLTKQKKITIENLELTKLFQRSFPKKITNHCINSKVYESDSIRNVSFCDEKYKIKLIDKKFNFYIFKLDAFEIDNYLLFNTENQTVYIISNFPQFLQEGKTVLDLGYEYGGHQALNFYIFDNKNLKYFKYKILNHYQIKAFKILNSTNLNPKVIVDLVKYGYKEVPNKPGFGKKYDYDKEKFCRKIIMFN